MGKGKAFGCAAPGKKTSDSGRKAFSAKGDKSMSLKQATRSYPKPKGAKK